MERIKSEDLPKIKPLFDSWNETLIWSCLQGHMGCAWADSSQNPMSAQIIVGDFCFFAGIPNMELVKNIPDDFHSDSILMIPQTNAWAEMIEKIYPFDNEKTLRYAIKKEPNAFNRENLLSLTEKFPPGYELKMIDEPLYNRAKSESWSQDFCSQFPTYKDYQAHGLGVMALYKDLPVSGASSYTYYNGGIEIEIDTKSDYRRKGLALACAQN